MHVYNVIGNPNCALEAIQKIYAKFCGNDLLWLLLVCLEPLLSRSTYLMHEALNGGLIIWLLTGWMDYLP